MGLSQLTNINCIAINTITAHWIVYKLYLNNICVRVCEYILYNIDLFIN